MQTLKDQTRNMWRSRLKAALRTAVACTIVGATSLYSPPHVRHLLAYPSFSYMTIILIVSDATLGDTFRGFWHVLYATVQVLLSSVLTLWLVGPARFTPGMAAVAVALTSFVVAIPESTHIMSKRIAFGQAVIVYVGTIIHGAETPVVMHPVHVALSTLFGASASIVALLLPYPRLAYTEVRRTCGKYVENALERLHLYLDAFCSGDGSAASESILKAKFSSKTGSRYLQSMKDYKEAVLWERPDIQFHRPGFMHLVERFEEVEMPLRGMALALNSSSFPIPKVDQELKDILPKREAIIAHKLNRTMCLTPSTAMTAPDIKDDTSVGSCPGYTRTIPISREDLPALFFLFCMELLQCDLPMTVDRTPQRAKDTKYKFDLKRWIMNLKPRSESLVFAFKCSITLGLAVLLGVLYNKKNGLWSGLTIAISFVRDRQPTFNMANSRGQGTAMGSVYGVLCFFMFERIVDLRLVSLLPWIVFATFLRHSRMYGTAGGTSTVVGALLILGRRDYGTPPDFAITRIAEATIGLICFVLVEILFQPARAATLARIELSRSFGEVKECLRRIVPCNDEMELPGSAFQEFQKRLISLEDRVSRYGEYTREAEIEPNFWFCPFPASCYVALLDTLSRTVDLLRFLAIQMDSVGLLCRDASLPWKDISDLLKDGIEQFSDRVGSSFECLEKVTSIKTIEQVNKELQKKTRQHDIEMGKSANPTPPIPSCIANEDVDKISDSLLDQLNKVIHHVHSDEVEEKVKIKVSSCLGALGFCIDMLMKETIAMEDMVKELITRHNPSCHADLHEIASKVDALRS